MCGTVLGNGVVCAEARGPLREDAYVIIDNKEVKIWYKITVTAKNSDKHEKNSLEGGKIKAKER